MDTSRMNDLDYPPPKPCMVCRAYDGALMRIANQSNSQDIERLEIHCGGLVYSHAAGEITEAQAVKSLNNVER